MRFDFCGRSAVILRTPDLALSALVNVCRHRGSRIVDGDPATGLAYCIDGKLRCPYHGWIYDTRGSLVHVPREEQYAGLDRAASGLTALQVASLDGWVFVAFHRPARGLTESFGEWSRGLAAYRCPQMRRLIEPRYTRVRANWKVVCEERFDPQGPAISGRLRVPGRAGVPPTQTGHDTIVYAGEISPADAVSWSSRTYAAQLARLTGVPGPERTQWMYGYLWPNTVFEFTPDQVVVTQLSPASPVETVLREVAYGLPDVSRAMRAARFLQQRLRVRSEAARVRLVERVQAGLATGDYVAGPLAADEPGVRWFTTRVRNDDPAH
jgi:phenylpropionate dioxygenase-like ring-hydroxylating dioxygenase large terminal subunit